MKTVLITGSNGFVGKNLSVTLAQRPDIKITGFDVADDPATLSTLVAEADFIFHLAGVNRPQSPEEFTTGNTGLTETIIALLQNQGKSTPFLLSSSTQALLDNPYASVNVTPKRWSLPTGDRAEHRSLSTVSPMSSASGAGPTTTVL
jgi:UDP-2-acetamido-2,6-beta-L-arabino-hexul-4-ose reductase